MWLVAAICLVAVVGACASERSPEVLAREIEGKVWSPFCPGRVLAECTTRQAAELREEIEVRLERGESPDQVMAWLTDEFGPEVRAEPPPGPAGLAVWLVPVGLALAGAFALVLALRRWSRAPVSAETPDGRPDEALLERVREEVERDL